MLWRTVRYFQAYASAKDGTLTILEPKAIYPINWREERNDACKTNNETGTLGRTQAGSNLPAPPEAMQPAIRSLAPTFALQISHILVITNLLFREKTSFSMALL